MSDAFYAAYHMEGWGHLAKPVTVGTKTYAYVNYEDKLGTKPENRSGQKFDLYVSCAGPEDLFIIPGSEITVEIPPAWMKLSNNKNFKVCDVGGKFEEGKPPHIDLYWDEDSPLGINGQDKFIPASFKGLNSTATCQAILTKLS